MLRVLEAQAPPKQNATETISTLCSRLASATLLEDRRAAILGLRSFAKQYPASVASGALRGLISNLARDVDDLDTGKVILETLLALFNPDQNSPEASDDITLWLADEFSQRQDNITVLLDLLEKNDFYSRLYSLQLLLAISQARPERTQECILSAPLGVTRLVSTLDDPRDAIRGASLLLLNEVTTSSPDLQKIVAFESAFERIFGLIQAEGSISQGGIIIQDCLLLLSNLLDFNASNQMHFRETGFIPRLAGLFNEPESDPEEDQLPPDPNREKNLWGLLALLRLFVVEGNTGTQANQSAFEKHGILQEVLNLSFGADFGPHIKAESLHTCADIIRGNAKLQEKFAHIQVSVAPSTPQGGTDAKPQTNGFAKVYIIEALLDLALTAAPPSLFDVRFAACECIQAYCTNHPQIREHFLARAKDGHASGEDETSNILSILIAGPQNQTSSDPYRIWFAAILFYHLLYESETMKAIARDIAEGDADKGEEVVTCIQAFTAHLVSSLQGNEDERICLAYLMILSVWLFEDPDAVDDLLEEGSTVQSLIQASAKTDNQRELAKGLCAFLLGILYKYSTKDSPVPRRTLQAILLKGMTRAVYIQRLAGLREHPVIRDFEVLPKGLASAAPGELPNVYFDQNFADFLKEENRRIERAIDQDPGREVARLGEGVDREVVDDLRSQIASKEEAVKVKDEALQKAESERLTAERRLDQEQAERRKIQESANAEVSRIKNINGALQQSHEAEAHAKDEAHKKAMAEQQQKQSLEIRAKDDGHRREMDNLKRSLESQIEDLKNQLQKAGEEHSKTTADTQKRHEDEKRRLEKDLSNLGSTSKQQQDRLDTLQRNNDSLSGTIKQNENKIASATESKQVLEETIELNTVNIRKLEDQVSQLERKAKEANDKVTNLTAAVKEKEEARQSAQTELDDLLIVLGDLEEKRSNDKKKLKELGVAVSDEEDEDGDGDEDEDEEGVDDGDVD